MTKPCGKCGTNEWDKRGRCIECRREYDRALYARNRDEIKKRKDKYNQDNRDKIRKSRLKHRNNNIERAREGTRQWRDKNPERVREYGKSYRQSNADKMSQNSREYYVKNRDKARAAARKWQQDHPDRVAANYHRREARKKGNGGDYTAEEWRQLCDHYGNRCLCCGRGDVKLTVDHIKPVEIGGTNDIGNIQPLCLSCNSRKHTRHIDYRPDTGILRWLQAKLFG